MPGEQDNREWILDQVINMSFSRHSDEKLTGGQEIQLLNEIKEDLFDALSAFEPDLPKQFSVQVQSMVNKMRESIEVIFYPDELNAMLQAYKINVDSLTSMMDPGRRESGDIQNKEEKEKHDDTANIRAKVQHFEGHFRKVYDLIQQRGINNTNLKWLKEWVRTMRHSNDERVEWMKQHTTPKE